MSDTATASGSMVAEVKIYCTFIDREEMDLGTVEANISGAEAFTVPRKKEILHLHYQGRKYSGKVDQVVNDISIDPVGTVTQQLFISCKKSQISE